MTDWTRATWRKSTRSGGNGGNCVEVATAGDHIGVRDSKNPDGPVLIVSPADWRAFISHLRGHAG